jgi:hypothetical protein
MWDQAFLMRHTPGEAYADYDGCSTKLWSEAITRPDPDWPWPLKWAEWTVEDAVEYRLWGLPPPQ